MHKDRTTGCGEASEPPNSNLLLKHHDSQLTGNARDDTSDGTDQEYKVVWVGWWYDYSVENKTEEPGGNTTARFICHYWEQTHKASKAKR